MKVCHINRSGPFFFETHCNRSRVLPFCKSRYINAICICIHSPLLHNNPRGKTAANIFAIFYSLSGDVSRFCKKFCVFAEPKRDTDGRIDRRTDANVISLAERLLRDTR